MEYKYNFKPIIKSVPYNSQGITHLSLNNSSKHASLIMDYPTVYILNNQSSLNQYDIYIGETNDVLRRSKQHLDNNTLFVNPEGKKLDLAKGEMVVIGHELFNKSLTLDIENKLMHFMLGTESVSFIHNKRTNAQKKYFTSDQLDEIFNNIWKKLHQHNRVLFPAESRVRDKAIFKASPFHKLTEEQYNAKELILEKVKKTLNLWKDDNTSKLIMVEGEAGSGKTVLLSTLFYELNMLIDTFYMDKYVEDHRYVENSDKEYYHPWIQMIINHEEQELIYKEIAKKLNLKDPFGNVSVCKPSTFIKNHSIDDRKADVILIDEAHLLLTQGNQGYSGKNHLEDLLQRAKIVITIFDEKQIMSTSQVWEKEDLEHKKDIVKSEDNYIYLKNQMRINADEHTNHWIRQFIDEGKLTHIPKDSLGYEIRIFNDIREMHEEITSKASNEDSSISRLLATYDWEYKGKKRIDEHGQHDKYKVTIGDWSLPWNNQVKRNKNLSWAEQPNTIDEVGSTFTIQGSDLNYAGVILGPSVKYRDGQIIHDPSATYNKRAKNKRSLKDNSKVSFAEQLLKNELNVLMTRGVNGLYIYAYDKELREKLLELSNRNLNSGDINE